VEFRKAAEERSSCRGFDARNRPSVAWRDEETRVHEEMRLHMARLLRENSERLRIPFAAIVPRSARKKYPRKQVE
jgi:hypothetical protein